VVAVLVATAGCADADEDGLLGALGQVRATDSTRLYVEYGDLAAIRRLSGTDQDKTDRDRFLGISGTGFSNLAPSAVPMTEDLRFDPSAMDEALVAGQPPDWVGVLWGDYDVEALDRELADRGIPSAAALGGTRWRSGADRELRVEGPLTGIARTNELNNLRTAPDSFIYAPARAGLDWAVLPGADTLADDPVLAALAGCLGDVVAAVFVRPEEDPTAYAVGVRAPSAAEVTDVACLAPTDAGTATRLRDRVEGELADGSAPSTRQPWSELLPDASVDVVDGAVVRIEAKPVGPVGRVLQMLFNRDLAALAG